MPEAISRKVSPRWAAIASCFRRIAAVAALCMIGVPIAVALPTFPGAGGGGAASLGGRAGIIYEVTNLNDSGAGSLRAGLALKVPRTIVFRVSGTIAITSSLDITEPYVTIAGQTAPGGGIQIIAPNSTQSMFWISTHDVVIRYLRLRHGYNPGTNQTGDPVSVENGYNVLVDHCTLMWSTDQNTNTWGQAHNLPAPTRLTWSWNIMAEPLSAHSTNFILGAAAPEFADAMVDIDAHHNLMANASHRNPLIKVKRFRFVNNIVYNWRIRATHTAGGVQADIIGNLYRTGSLQNSGHEISVFPVSTGEGDAASGSPGLFVAGNVGPFNANPQADNWPMVWEIAQNENGVDVGPLSTAFRRNAPLPALPVPIGTDLVTRLEALMLPEVGASRRLDCLGNFVPNRDRTDVRIINEYRTGTGIIPATEADVGGFPVIAGGIPCPDTDHDAMPDAWEIAHGLGPANPLDGPLDSDGDGYTNLEEYLNGATMPVPQPEPRRLRVTP